MNARRHPDPSVVAKDALRGIRYAMKRNAKLVVEGGPRQLPEQFEAASTNFLKSAEAFAKTIDRAAKHILGLEYDPKTFGPPAFMASSGGSLNENHLSTNASNLFFALSFASKLLELKDILVSEALCVRILAEDALVDWPVGKQDTASQCAELYLRILHTNVVGDPPGVSSQHNSDRRRDIQKVAFAVSLWAYTERYAFDDSEVDLLEMCCAVTINKADDLLSAKDDQEAVRALFHYALSII